MKLLLKVLFTITSTGTTKINAHCIIEGPLAVAREARLEEVREILPIIVFDEIHKYRNCKRFLRGFFDLYEKKCRILVTGSARLDVYKRGGDNLMGRYFLYRLHPLSVREITSADYEALMTYSGFPEPYLKRSKAFFSLWKKTSNRSTLSIRLARFEPDPRDESNSITC